MFAENASSNLKKAEKILKNELFELVNYKKNR